MRFVGGCVRNAVMGFGSSDLDLSTQLTPDETEAALAAAGIKSVPTGKAFGTITAVMDGEPYEITSLREDVETDGRRAVVSYTTDWEKDAQRPRFLSQCTLCRYRRHGLRPDRLRSCRRRVASRPLYR